MFLDKSTPRRLEGRILIYLPVDLGYALQIARGIQRFKQLHPQLHFVRSQSNSDLRQIRPDSCLGAIGFFSTKTQFTILKQLKIEHVVSVSNRVAGVPCSQCITDDIRVGELAAEYFHRKHYQHVACHTLEALTFSQLRTKGFVDWMKTHAGIDTVRLNHVSFTEGRVKNFPFPLGLFCASDQNALNIQGMLKSHGVSIPDEVAMVGVDDDEHIAPFIPVPLSSVRLAGERVGFEACLMIERMHRGESSGHEQKLIEPVGIRERKSSETVAVQDPLVRRVCAYIDDHLSDLHDISELADALHTSRRNLDRQFTSATGLTPAQWLMRKRVEYAEKLLMETDYTVEHVAERSGLGTKPRLYLSFKKAGRPLPSILRREKKQQGFL